MSIRFWLRGLVQGCYDWGSFDFKVIVDLSGSFGDIVPSYKTISVSFKLKF